MKNLLLSVLTILLTFNLSFTQQEDRETVFFNSDKYNLSYDFKLSLDSLIQKTSDKPITKISIFGHTDSDGNKIYNDSLSKKRASTVSNYLTEHGLDETKIIIDYFGELDSVSNNNNEPNKQKNRRVDILIEYDFSIPKGFIVNSKDFEINPNMDTVIIVNSKGTQIHIPKYSFVDDSGKRITEIVTLKFKEYTNSAEIAFSQIPMNYELNNQSYCFNSSGMFEISGEAQGTPVKMAYNKTLTIDYALAKQNPDISFFKLKSDKSNWVKIQDIQPNINQKIGVNQIHLEDESKVKVSWIRSLLHKLSNKSINQGGRHKGNGAFQIKDDGNRENGTLLAEGADAGHTYPDIIKGLNINGFGVYNCDQIYRLGNKVNVIATYVDTNGNPIKNPNVISLIDLKYNGAFSFDPKQFICDADGENVLALFTKNGDLYLLDQPKFKEMNIKESGQYRFTMTNMTGKINNTKDLASHLGINI